MCVCVCVDLKGIMSSGLKIIQMLLQLITKGSDERGKEAGAVLKKKNKTPKIPPRPVGSFSLNPFMPQSHTSAIYPPSPTPDSF